MAKHVDTSLLCLKDFNGLMLKLETIRKHKQNNSAKTGGRKQNTKKQKKKNTQERTPCAKEKEPKNVMFSKSHGKESPSKPPASASAATGSSPAPDSLFRLVRNRGPGDVVSDQEKPANGWFPLRGALFPRSLSTSKCLVGVWILLGLPLSCWCDR